MKRTTRLKQASTCAAKLKVLADSTRLAVLESILDGPKTVGAIQQLLGVEQSCLSHHLQLLREAGLVKTRRMGKSVLYSLSTSVTARASGAALDLGCCLLSFE